MYSLDLAAIIGCLPSSTRCSCSQAKETGQIVRHLRGKLSCSHGKHIEDWRVTLFYYCSLNFSIMISSSVSFFSGFTIFSLINSPTGAIGASARHEKKWMRLLLVFTYLAVGGCKLHNCRVLFGRFGGAFGPLLLLQNLCSLLSFCLFDSRSNIQLFFFIFLGLFDVGTFL